MRRKNKINNRQESLISLEKKTPKDIFRNVRNYLAGQYVGATRMMRFLMRY